MNLSEATALRQHHRLLRLSFPGGAPAAMMVVNHFHADEGLSRDFEYVVEVLSDSARISVDEVHGKKATVSLVREDGSLRHFNGHIFEFRLLATDGGFATYRMVLRPWLAFARLRRDNYLFHGKTVEDQTAEIFADYPADWRTKQLGPDPAMTDAYQANESDHNYLHRRWEALGWHYWYEHSEGGHTLVLCGDSTAADPIDGDPAIPYRAEAGSAEDDALSLVSASRIAAAASAAAASFDFKKPRPAAIDVPTIDPPAGAPALEDYRWTGGYGFKDLGDGDAQARLRMQEIEAGARPIHAAGNDRFAMPGRWFTLAGHFDPTLDGTPLLVVSMRHEAHNNFDSDQPPVYRNEITAVRKATPWHPGRGFHSVDTKVHAPQTATVVGPPGEEIHTDEYGRVRVQFHWDRVGAFDHRSSAWLRVVTAWSGPSFGMTHIPRVGTEVVVQFLDGNPDRPIITGMVPNEATMPPWELPANKTQSGILSRSTPQGAYENANALRFEDKKGAEQLWLHAERDQLTEVEHDEDKWVGNDRRKTIDRDETNHISRDRTETVDRDERITVHGQRIEEVDGDETITIHSNRSERVDHDERISIGDNRTEQVGIDETLHIGRNRERSVGENEGVRIGREQRLDVGASRHKTIGASEDVRIGSDWSINVGSSKKETIGSTAMQNVALAKMVNVGAAYNLNVGGLMATIVGMNQTTKVIGSRDVDVGGDQSVKVGKKFTIDVGDEFAIECGETKFVMKSDGSVFITGKKFNFTAQGEDVEINGRHIFLNPEGGKAAVQPKGAKQGAQAPAAPTSAAGGSPRAPGTIDSSANSLVAAGTSASPFEGMTLGSALGTVSKAAGMASQLGIGGKNMAMLGQLSGMAAGVVTDPGVGQLAQGAGSFFGQGGGGGSTGDGFGDLEAYFDKRNSTAASLDISEADTARENAKFDRQAATRHPTPVFHDDGAGSWADTVRRVSGDAEASHDPGEGWRLQDTGGTAALPIKALKPPFTEAELREYYRIASGGTSTPWTKGLEPLASGAELKGYSKVVKDSNDRIHDLRNPPEHPDVVASREAKSMGFFNDGEGAGPPSIEPGSMANTSGLAKAWRSDNELKIGFGYYQGLGASFESTILVNPSKAQFSVTEFEVGAGVGIGGGGKVGVAPLSGSEIAVRAPLQAWKQGGNPQSPGTVGFGPKAGLELGVPAATITIVEGRSGFQIPADSSSSARPFYEAKVFEPKLSPTINTSASAKVDMVNVSYKSPKKKP